MEEELGVSLFERDNRSVALTPAGERFRRHARELLSQWDDIRQSLLEDSDELRGELSLYCSVTASYSFLMRFSPPSGPAIRMWSSSCIPVTPPWHWSAC